MKYNPYMVIVMYNTHVKNFYGYRITNCNLTGSQNLKSQT